MKFAAIALLILAGSAAAANLDGKWTADVAPAGKKAATAKKPQNSQLMLDLKSDGSQLTGSVFAGRGKKARPMAIQNGKIEGDRFTFTTVQHGKKGDTTFNWQGTLTGEQINGTRSRDRARRGVSFTAKRQS
jgi:hypothetical protein